MAQTNANLIWNIANLLRGPYQPNQYGDVILSIAPRPLGALHLKLQQLVRGDQAFMLGREIAALHGVPD